MNGFSHAVWQVVWFLDLGGLLLALLGGALFAYGPIRYLLRHNLGPEGAALPPAMWRGAGSTFGKRMFLCGCGLALCMFALRLVLPGAG